MKKLRNPVVLYTLLLTCLISSSAGAGTERSETASPQYVLQVSADHGVVTSTPEGISCGAACLHHFDGNAIVTLKASARTGFTFTGWSEAGCGDKETCTVAMTEAKSVKATFSQNMYNLAVTMPAANTGSGSVKTSSSDISCGKDCSEAYQHGTFVTLTAIADAGSAFYGWSGDCSGTSICRVTMDDVKNVSAIFIAREPPVLAGAAFDFRR